MFVKEISILWFLYQSPKAMAGQIVMVVSNGWG